MTKKRRKFNQQFKFKVALEAAKELESINEIASKFGVHPSQVKSWKKQLLAEGEGVFGRNTQQQIEHREKQLNEQIERLKIEIDWLKNLPLSNDE